MPWVAVSGSGSAPSVTSVIAALSMAYSPLVRNPDTPFVDITVSTCLVRLVNSRYVSASHGTE